MRIQGLQSDHIDYNSWKHGPEASGGTKFVDSVSGGVGAARSAS